MTIAAEAQGSSSFLKKRTKKLLLCFGRAGDANQRVKRESFLFLFFKKQILPSLPDVSMAPGERILWQGGPDWRAVACRVFHIRAIAAYFTAVTLINIGIVRNAQGPGLPALQGGLATAVTSLVCAAILACLAFATGRTTRYTLTTRRVIMQFGIALPATLMLPLHRIAQSSVAIRADHSGDFALRLYPGEQIPYVKLWPHARPWRLRRAEPMLRDIPRAAALAVRLTHALTACAEAKRAAQTAPGHVPAAPRDATPIPVIA